MSEPILVLGARGKLGREVVEQLYQAGFPTRCATRNPGVCGHECIGGGCARFDYDRPETFAAAVEGVSHIFMIARPLDPAASHVMPAFIDTCRDAGVEHVIFASALNVDRSEGAPLHMVERYLERSGMGWTILRPNFFMENFSEGWLLPQILHDSRLQLPAGDGATSFISVKDIGAVALRVLTEPGHVGRCYDLTGGESLDHDQVAALISDVTGRTIAYESIGEALMQDMASKAGLPGGKLEYLLYLYRMVRQGDCARILPTVQELLGRAPRTFAEFVRDAATVWRREDAQAEA